MRMALLAEYDQGVASRRMETVASEMNTNSTPADLPRVEIYTDGGCEPNPGPGGYGVVLVHPRKRAEISGGFRKTTNNRMEIYAAIAGLELLNQPCHAKPPASRVIAPCAGCRRKVKSQHEHGSRNQRGH